MICPKCTGLMVSERVEDFQCPITVAKCLNCGTVLDWLTYRNRLLSKAKGVTMPRFLSEESKQAWAEKVRATKLAKKKA